MTAPPQTVEVRLTRELDAPPAAVFRAWTVPSELAARYGAAQSTPPRTGSTSTCAWAGATS